MREPRESGAVEVDGQRVVGDDEDIYAEVELLVANEEGVVDVALDNVGLGGGGSFCPFRDVADFGKEEDAFALAFADGFHDPDVLILRGFLVFFEEDGVLAGQVKGEWHEVVGICLFSFAVFF